LAVGVLVWTFVDRIKNETAARAENRMRACASSPTSSGVPKGRVRWVSVAPPQKTIRPAEAAL